MRKIYPFLIACFACAETKPANISVNTWVREDLFAGYMVNDLARFEKGMSKLDEIMLNRSSENRSARAWRASGILYLGVRALEGGNVEEFARRVDEAEGGFNRARTGATRDELGAIYAIQGGAYALFADRFPIELRKEGWGKVQEHYSKLRELQMPAFDKYPQHMRGEVLAGLAQAAQRLGQTDEAEKRLNELIAALPNSVYATRALRWKENPQAADKTNLTCQTCHEPGRLK